MCYSQSHSDDSHMCTHMLHALQHMHSSGLVTPRLPNFIYPPPVVREQAIGEDKPAPLVALNVVGPLQQPAPELLRVSLPICHLQIICRY